MQFGKVDISRSIVANGWEWFLSYYEKVLKDKVTEKPEKIFKALGGEVPKKEK